MPPRDRSDSSPPAPPPPPEEQLPMAIIVPANVSEADQEAIARSLYRDHGEYILKFLLRQGDIQPASAEDIRQRVILFVRDRLVEKAAEGAEEPSPAQLRAFVREVTDNKASNYKRVRRKRRYLLCACDADTDDAPSSAMDPERAMVLAQHKAMVERLLAKLPPEDAEVARAIGLDQMTLDEAAKKLGRSRSSVHRTHMRIMKELRKSSLAERDQVVAEHR